MQQLAAEYNIELRHGKPYHPNEQGKVERVNGTINKWLTKAMLSAQVSERWIDFVPEVEHTYRVTVHQTAGCSPFEAMFRRKYHGPIMYVINLVKYELNVLGLRMLLCTMKSIPNLVRSMQCMCIY